MESGIVIQVISSDQDLIQVEFRCSNTYFSGGALLYLGHDEPAALAKALRGFPTGIGDARHFELGTFESSYALGGARMAFRCSDAAGHCFVEVTIRGDNCRAVGEPQSVALKMPIEAAAVDTFIQQIEGLSADLTDVASLPMRTR